MFQNLLTVLVDNDEENKIIRSIDNDSGLTFLLRCSCSHIRTQCWRDKSCLSWDIVTAVSVLITCWRSLIIQLDWEMVQPFNHGHNMYYNGGSTNISNHSEYNPLLAGFSGIISWMFLSQQKEILDTFYTLNSIISRAWKC